MQYMSRMHELEEARFSVVAGDLNVREGDDHCMCAEGWRDALRLPPFRRPGAHGAVDLVPRQPLGQV